MSGRADLERLERELAACLVNVVELARSARAQTAAEWSALFEAMCGARAPLPFTGDGANAAEVRAVLLSVPAGATAGAIVPVPSPAVQLHRCKTCGAPRRADGLYGDCLYCGQPVFTGYKEID